MAKLQDDGWLSGGRWVAKLVERLYAAAALWVRIQTSLKNTEWATKAKEWPTHSSSPKIYKKIVPKIIFYSWLI